MVVGVKTQLNFYDTVGKSMGYCTIFEMIIVIGSNQAIKGLLTSFTWPKLNILTQFQMMSAF